MLIKIAGQYECFKKVVEYTGDSLNNAGAFYNKNCDCKTCKFRNIRGNNVKDKAKLFVSKYEYFPTNSYILLTKTMSKEECIEAHIKLVKEFNEMVDKYAYYDTSRLYRHIKAKHSL